MQLCFSIESGKNSNDTIKRNSEVFDAIKLDCYYVNGICVEEPNSAPIVAQNLAHTYGDTIRGQRSCPYTSDSEIQNAPQNCYYFSNTNGKEFAARYAEYNPDDSARAYPFFSNRIVKTFAGECFQYEIFNFPNKIIKTDSHDGIQDTWVWEYYNSTVNDTIDIPRREAALDATTYIYNGFHEPDSEEATRQTCGPRCSWLYAWHSKRNSTDRPLLFRCPINVSEVSNVNNDLQEVPNRIARLAAASIALTGRKTNDWRQFRLYPWGSHWDIGNNITTSGVGARMAEFAIGSLATMANLNPQFRTQGTLPVLGYHLSIKWAYVITVAAFIAVTHFILVVSMLIIARSVVVNDDSNLCTARLLVGLLQRFEKQGSLLDGKRIANAIQDEEGTGERRLVYGKVEKEGRRWLSLGKDVKVIKGRFSSEEYA